MMAAAKYPQSRADGRRREILEAALACFAERGLGATTIEHVRERSAASTGSIYHHFRDKDGLAAEVYRHVLGGYHRSLLEAVAKLDDGRPLIEGIVRHLLSWVAAHPDAARFLVEMRQQESVLPFDGAIRHDTEQLIATLSTRIERSARAGLVRDLPRHLYPAIVAAPAMAVVASWVRAGLSGDPTADADLLADAAWRALEPR